jgi:DNA repair exonuclease SbcCD ATPase subunit
VQSFHHENFTFLRKHSFRESTGVLATQSQCGGRLIAHQALSSGNELNLALALALALASSSRSSGKRFDLRDS